MNENSEDFFLTASSLTPAKEPSTPVEVVTVIKGGIELIKGHKIKFRDVHPEVTEWQEIEV